MKGSLLRVAGAVMMLLALTSCSRGEASDAAVLTRGDVEALVKRVDTAGQARDVDALEDFLAADVRIELTISVNGEVQTLRMDRDEYLQQSREGLEQASDYELTPGVPTITIAADGKSAEVKQASTERMTMMGQRLVGRSQSASRVQATADGPKYVWIKASTTMGIE